MIRLRELSNKVMDVYQILSKEFNTFQSKQGLTCIEKCGACCNNPDIEVSPLELLPYALHLLETGQALKIYDELNNSETAAVCLQYRQTSLSGDQGYCGMYEYRPGICRMFGAAGFKTKSGSATLSVCKPIKTSVPEKYAAALIATQALSRTTMTVENNNRYLAANSENAKSACKPPMIDEGRQRIAQLDYELGEKLMPINQALKYALEKILLSDFYACSEGDNAAA